MILLAMFSMAVIFIIPKMTAGLGTCGKPRTRANDLDQQALEEYRAQQPAAPQLPSFDFASFMAGSGSKKPAAVEQSKKSK
jgi:4-diphosphocytidyl-2C-methyl-D-erythritol kinase